MSDISQFIRTNSYGLTVPKKQKEGGHSVRSIIAEVNREPGSCPHVENPQPPILLHGCLPDQIEKKCEAWASTVTDAAGRKLRKDALCLVAGVVSVPAGTEDWPAYRDATVSFLKKKYGDALECVVEHVDEDQPHIHFYVIARPGQRFETIHEGRAAADAIVGKGMKASKDVAYSAAMTLFQDRFYEAVSKGFGFSRVGPQAPRVSRSEAVKRKEMRKAVAAEIQRELPVAIEKGINQGRKKGFEIGVGEGKSEFEQKSLWSKMTEMVAGLKNQNKVLSDSIDRITKESKSIGAKYLALKEKYISCIDELKKLRPEVTRLRSKNSELTRDNSALQKSLANLDDTKKELSSAKSSIRHLQLVVDSYKKEDQARLDELRKVDKALKNKQKPLSNSLDYS